MERIIDNALIDNALIYGAMFRVDEPHLVDRYNRALQGFGLPPTSLETFIIDAMGYSPDIAKEFGDKNYLDPNEINPRFIILSPEQEDLPVISTSFTSTADLMKAFFVKNAESLNTLTLKDVVFGEIEDSTYRIDSIEDILSIKKVHFKIRTSGELFSRARELKKMVNRFYAEDDSWRNDRLMDDILRSARLVGDIRFNNIIPRYTEFELPSFWTSHFGGLYVFHDEDGVATLIGEEQDPEFIKGFQDELQYIWRLDHDSVYQFLTDTGRISGFEPRWLEVSGLVERRIELYVSGKISESNTDTDLRRLSPDAMQNWIHRNYDDLASDGVFSFLMRVRKALVNGRMPVIRKSDAEMKLLIVRAGPEHPDRALVARLLSSYSRFDFLNRFAVNKPGFYEDYARFPENLKQFAIQKITRSYFSNADRYWEKLLDTRKD